MKMCIRDRFNATVNKIHLNKVKPPKVVVAGIPQGSGRMHGKDWMPDPQDQQTGATELSNEAVSYTHLSLPALCSSFNRLNTGMYL